MLLTAYVITCGFFYLKQKQLLFPANFAKPVAADWQPTAGDSHVKSMIDGNCGKIQVAIWKIKNAKDYILKHLDNPPTLKELSKIAGINDYQLKVGFKEIYGSTVFGFLLNHRLDHSRVLLDSGKFLVNEVAYQIGYTNPSHFIAAFRKKFGITPKKYLINHGH